MNTQSIKHNIEIIANVGVLLGIILLAYEVNQNNQLLAAEARATHMQSRAGLQEGMAREEGLMKLRLKAANNEPLAQDEEWRLVSDAASSFTRWEYDFDQYQEGNLDALVTNAYIQHMRTWPHHLTVWKEWGHTYNPDFVAFMEDNVINQLE
jgi:hypothetical protein